MKIENPHTLLLSGDEQVMLGAFLVFQQRHALRLCLPMEKVVEKALNSQGFQVRRVGKVQYHPVWHIVMCPVAPACPRSSLGVRGALRRAFRIAGHTIPADCISVVRCDEQRIEVAICLLEPAKPSRRKSNLPSITRFNPRTPRRT